MRNADGLIRLSATDLVGHLACRHLSALDLSVATGKRAEPKGFDPFLDALVKRGLEHERGFIEHLGKSGVTVATIDGPGGARQVADTIAAMRKGLDVIVQAALVQGRWEGRADILRRIAMKTKLGDWGYEVIDTKLARETKGGTVLQLCLYSDLVAGIQGELAEKMYVVTPLSGYVPLEFRTNDYMTYCRFVRVRLEAAVDGAESDTYPDPKAHCDICRWDRDCDARRRKDDHLSLVAGISKMQIGELEGHAIETTEALSTMPLPMPWKPKRGAARTYDRIREQARVQVEGRRRQEPVHEVLPPEPGYGLSRLPQPSPGDVFFDFEGDPFVGEAGLEYLFGYCVTDDAGALRYEAKWALNAEEEKAAFESFVDWVMARWQRYPGMHIYHYAPYEPAALKRLMGRYATREEEIDRMLRAEMFVDLYAVVKHGVRASVESYSIKKLECFYGFERSTELSKANGALARLQASLELGGSAEIEPKDRAVVEGYNSDDCASTYHLRSWLEGLRSAQIANGTIIDRPKPGDGAPTETVSDWTERIEALHERLIDGIPADPAHRTAQQQATWILANILDWHRRENKAVWWERFRLSALNAEELADERDAISGLRFLKAAGGRARWPIHRYSFPFQDTDLRGGEVLRNVGGGVIGKLDAIDFVARTADIRKSEDSVAVHPEAVFSHEFIGTDALAEALATAGEDVAERGIAGCNNVSASRLLLRRPPPNGDPSLCRDNESVLEAALRIVPTLAGDVLPIQGPPGTGKTHTGAEMICTLVAQGARVGITANSHKVIRNLLDKVVEIADRRNIDLRAIAKIADKEPNTPRIEFTKDNPDVFAALEGTCRVAAGTAWMWARPDAARAVDVLFVDEAAQMSLANVLAVSQAGASLVLLGDPQQLDQPTKGSHPDGTDGSALAHILGGHQTIEKHRGLFLEQTWRLHPDICRFTSETFYEGRLKPIEGLENQRVVAMGPLHGSGLRFVPVRHSGNKNSAPEEAVRIEALVATLLAGRPSWVNRHGEEKPLTLADVLIIAPYNAQVFAIQDRLPRAKVGTVDKFQGQEAPVVIYSMATSTPEEAPRGMEFLYSLNRLNVATSRAQCVCAIVASPDLFEPECRTPRQIQLANAHCRFRELAEPVNP